MRKKFCLLIFSLVVAIVYSQSPRDWEALVRAAAENGSEIHVMVEDGLLLIDTKVVTPQAPKGRANASINSAQEVVNVSNGSYTTYTFKKMMDARLFCKALGLFKLKNGRELENDINRYFSSFVSIVHDQYGEWGYILGGRYYSISE